MTPYHLELLLFLRMNKDLWNANDMQDVIDNFADHAVAASQRPPPALAGQAQGEVVNDAKPNLAV
jgi:hypothetical protein